MWFSGLSLGLLTQAFQLPFSTTGNSIQWPSSLNDTNPNVLTQSQLASIVPYAQFARVAYCPTSKIRGWECGHACQALPGFQLSLVGGNGDRIQNYFVGFWPQENSVIVGHQGTDPTHAQAVLTDLNIEKGNLDKTLFPGVPHSIEVHDGFRNEHAITAPVIFAEVQTLLERTGAKRVVTIGHSLGGALSILEGLSLRLRLPLEITISVRAFGAPRVGDAEFAAFFDSKVQDVQRVNNKHDMVPVVPPRLMGFKHPRGEIHIVYTGHAVACTGDDLIGGDHACTNAMVPDLLRGNVQDHLGPYEGVNIGTISCN